ncbi:MAG TPA: protein-disulfide reductase DsbD domain-containing protein [Terriglobales bacterium]|nr:protein-disulfide reductase DsbD domain-containing protein [Terriglobales bacterium]
MSSQRNTGFLLKRLAGPVKRSFLFLLLALAPCAFGQDEFGPKGPVVTLTNSPTITAVQTQSASASLTFNVAKGYHINSNRPKSEFLIPTALKIDAATDIVIGKTIYPEGQDMSFAFAPDEKLNVYTGDFNVDVMVHPLRSVQPGKYVVRGTLRYQACDNTACYPPKNLPVSFDVKIAKAPAARSANPAQSPHAH